ncbi:MAG: hypothetical protein HY921_05910 [Elusimicrobia bacterium]|nr:hypothetical protein [Elusimicrobiota bacterium]
MILRILSAIFFLVYGSLLPVAAHGFMAENVVASLAMMGCCYVIAALLWSRRALLLNILIAFYVLRVYLTRPYVDIFLAKLRSDQLNYILDLNSFFNPSDAAVVYRNLLALLSAWLLGLLLTPPVPAAAAPVPWLFRRLDKIVGEAGWSFWLIWLLLSVVNYMPATQMWQGMAMDDEGTRLFAWGLFSLGAVNIVCLFSYIRSRRAASGAVRPILLFPVILGSVLGVSGGSRGTGFFFILLAISYWLFLNADLRVGLRDSPRMGLFSALVPVTVFCGLVGQSLRPLLRTGADADLVWTAFLRALNPFNPNNPVLNDLYFGLTELLHRVSSIKAPFLILNNHYVHDPWETYNPVYNLMGTINALLPGSLKPFSDIIGINQLFDYIYYDLFVTYNSETWGIQGTLYLYFGHWLAPLVVFLLACFCARRCLRLEAMARESPAFAAFFILLFSGFIEFGVVERAVPVDIVRPLASFAAVIFLDWLMRMAFVSQAPGLSPPAELNAAATRH